MDQKLMEKTSLDTQSFILSKSPLRVTSKKAKGVDLFDYHFTEARENSFT